MNYSSASIGRTYGALGRTKLQEHSPPVPRWCPLSGRRVRLRSVGERDYDYLYGLFTSEQLIFQWRLRGATPSPEVFKELLWRQVFLQFLVEETRTNSSVGLVSAYNADHLNGTAYLSVILDPERHRIGWTLEAAYLFLNYLFTTWRFRILFGETLAVSYSAVRSGLGVFFHEDGCLRDHEYFDGQYWDLHLLSIRREDWERTRDRFFGRGSRLPRRIPRADDND